MPLANADEKARSKDLLKAGKFLEEPQCTFEEVVEAFNRLLHLTDDWTVRVSLAAVIANRLADADPVWLLLVAPSASAKTEFVMALSKVEGTYLMSQVTPNTFLSGMTGTKNDPSLLSRLGSQVILLQKDFTTVLSMRQDNRGEILAQLREIFDGRFVREFGTGQTKSWEGRLGFISGVTLEIEQAIMTGSRLGDRFLYFRLPPVDDRDAMKKAGKNLFSGAGLREEVQRKVAGYLSHLQIPEQPPELPERLLEACRSLCAAIVRARAPVIRDQFGSKDIVDVPIQEGPARFYKEITSMCHALAIMRGGKWDWNDYPIAVKLAFDAVPRRRVRLLDALLASDGWSRTADLALAVSLPTRTTHFVLDELECCGLAERRKKDGGNSPDEWRVTFASRELAAFRKSPDGLSVSELKETQDRYDRLDEPAGQAQIKVEEPQF